MIIGFGFKAQNGKDTAGEAIVSYYASERDKQRKHGLAVASPQARVFKFADALYKVCREEYGMVGKDAPLLQKVGAGRRDEFGLDYWIKQLEIQMYGFTGLAVITDCRYQNEANWIKSHNGYVIEVSRLNQDGSQFIAADRDPNHPSEIDLVGYNFDSYIRSKSAALTAELAITHTEYYRGLNAR